MRPTHPILDRLAEILPDTAERETDSIELRKLAPAVVKQLRDLGVMRTIQPRRYGGFEADPRVFNEVVFTLARASSSAGWVTGVVGVHSWHLGLYDDKAQAEVWGDDPDTWISSSYGPSGTARAVPGGYELTGRWSFSSGSDQCEWVFVGGMATDDAGGPPVYRHFLLPRPDYEIRDVWNTSGLVGTGSNDIVVSEAFVPDHRTMAVSDLHELRCPGRAVNTGPLFAMPWFSVFLNAVVVPLVGMAAAGLDEALAVHRAKVAADPGRMPGELTLSRLAEASAAVDNARTLLLHNLGESYETAAAAGTPSVDHRLRAKRDHMVAVGLAVSAVDKAYQSGGPRSIALASPLQRIWRDVHAGEHHAVNLPDAAFPDFGRYLVTGDAGPGPF